MVVAREDDVRLRRAAGAPCVCALVFSPPVAPTNQQVARSSRAGRTDHASREWRLPPDCVDTRRLAWRLGVSVFESCWAHQGLASSSLDMFGSTQMSCFARQSPVLDPENLSASRWPVVTCPLRNADNSARCEVHKGWGRPRGGSVMAPKAGVQPAAAVTPRARLAGVSIAQRMAYRLQGGCS